MELHTHSKKGNTQTEPIRASVYRNSTGDQTEPLTISDKTDGACWLDGSRRRRSPAADVRARRQPTSVAAREEHVRVLLDAYGVDA